MYSSVIINKPDFLKFLHGSRYIGLEIVTIMYSTGVAVFGASIEIYLCIPHVIVNCVLFIRNCDGESETATAIIWVFKVLCLFVTNELCYQNFRRLPDYEMNVNAATRTMHRQAVLYIVTMLFLFAPGLRALYDAFNTHLSHLCTYTTNRCGMINLYQPTFSYHNDRCLDDLTAYVSGREHLRFLRNFTLLNGISYSIFNENFLELHNNAKHVFLRIALVILHAILTTSVLISYIDPFIFIERCRLIYHIIECAIFIILLGLPAYNLYDIHRQNLSQNSPSGLHIRSMDQYLKVLPTM